MSLRKDEEEPRAVAAVVEKDLFEWDDVKPGRRRQARGKMRLRGKLGGRKVRSPEEAEKKAAEKEAKKQERKELILAMKLSRAEFRKSVKEERSRSESGRSKTPRRGKKDSESREMEKLEKKCLRLARKLSRKESKRSKKIEVDSKRRRRVPNGLGGFKTPRRSESRTRKEKRIRSESKEARKLEKAQEKQAKRIAREEDKRAAEIHVTIQEEPKRRMRNPLRPKDPNFPKIRLGKLVHAPAAFKSMRRAVQRR